MQPHTWIAHVPWPSPPQSDLNYWQCNIQIMTVECAEAYKDGRGGKFGRPSWVRQGRLVTRERKQINFGPRQPDDRALDIATSMQQLKLIKDWFSEHTWIFEIHSQILCGKYLSYTHFTTDPWIDMYTSIHYGKGYSSKDYSKWEKWNTTFFALLPLNQYSQQFSSSKQKHIEKKLCSTPPR